MAKTITITKELIEQYVEKLNESIGKSIDYAPQLKAFDTDKKTHVTFSHTAAVKMLTLLFSCKGEVGWHGTVERRDYGFFIKNIYIYPQFVTGATVTTDDDEYNKWLLSLDDEEFNTMRFHGHSHVNMAVSPSTTDMNHRKDILGRLRQDDFYIFMIINKNLDWTVSIYDMENNVEYSNADISVSIFEGFDAFATDVQNKVREKKYEYKTKTEQEPKKSKQTTDTKKDNVIPYSRYANGYRYPQGYNDQVDFDDWIYGDRGHDYQRVCDAGY